jgi:hypothetical protein
MLEAGPEHAHNGTAPGSSVVVSSHDDAAALHAATSLHHMQSIQKVSESSQKNFQLGNTEWDFLLDDENQGDGNVKTVEKPCNRGAAADGDPGMVQMRDEISVNMQPGVCTRIEEGYDNEVPFDSSSEFASEVIARGKDITCDFLERERRYIADAPPLLIKDAETVAEDFVDYNQDDSFKENGDMYEGGKNRQYQGSIHSDSDCDSHGAPMSPESRVSLSKRKTLGSSSGSDVALHEGAELSEDEQHSGIYKSRFALIVVIAAALLIKVLITRTSIKR